MDNIRFLMRKMAAKVPRSKRTAEIASTVVEKLRNRDKKMKLAACAMTYENIQMLKEASLRKQSQEDIPDMLDPETEAAVAQHDLKAMRQAGGLVGAGLGTVGGAGVGAGAGALVGRALKRNKYGPWGALAGALAGGAAGGLAGPRVGQRMAPKITAQDLERMNQEAFRESLEMGIDPELAAMNLLKFHGQLGRKGKYQLEPYLNVPE